MPETEVAEPEKKPEPVKDPAVPKPVSLLDSIKIVKEGNEIGRPAPAVPEKEPEKTETVPEAKKPDIKEEAKQPSDDDKKQWSSSARQHFDSLQRDRDEKREKLKKTESEAAAIRAENERLKTDLQKGAQSNETIRKYEEQIEHLKQELRLGSIERDPEFVEKYVTSRESRFDELKTLAKHAGVDDDEFQRALRMGDDDKLSEWRDALPRKSQVAWDAHLTAVANIDFEKQQAIKNAGKTYEQLQEGRKKQWQAQAQQATQKNVEIANSVIEDMLSKIPALKEDNDLMDEVRSTLHDVAGGSERSGEWDSFKIMQHIGAAKTMSKVIPIQQKVIEGQREELEASKAEVEKLKKELEEKDSFISSRANGMPRSDSFTSKPATDSKPRSIMDDLVIRIPGHNS